MGLAHSFIYVLSILLYLLISIYQKGMTFKLAKNKKNTLETVWHLVEPIIENLGRDLIIWDIRFFKEGANWILRIYIDNKSGNIVTIEDCEIVSRAIDLPLDEADPIEQSYCLEVSSPGVERELTREQHFYDCIDENIMVKMIRPMSNGLKEFKGKLIAADKTMFTVQVEDIDIFNGADINIINNNSVNINKKDTAWVKLDDFDI